MSFDPTRSPVRKMKMRALRRITRQALVLYAGQPLGRRMPPNELRFLLLLRIAVGVSVPRSLRSLLGRRV